MKENTLIANIYPLSLFDEMDSAYWGLGYSTVKEKLFFALCSHNPIKSTQLFSWSPLTQLVTPVADLQTTFPLVPGTVPQGKVHTPLIEGKDGNLYFATHFAYPYGIPQNITYEGGHWMCLTIEDEKIHDLGLAVKDEGIITLVMDKERMLLYALTAPSCYLLIFDIATRKTTNMGTISSEGAICRTLVLDDEGNVYGSFEPNKIFCYSRTLRTITILDSMLPDAEKKITEWVNPGLQKASYLGRQLWRTAVWDKKTKKIYGIHAGTSQLFILDPKTNISQESVFMGSDSSKDHVDAIYPTLSLTKDADTIVVAACNGMFDYQRSEQIRASTHIVSYNISTKKRIDHGALTDTSGRMVYGIAGATFSKYTLYYLGAVEVLPNESYNNRNLLMGKPFHLALIILPTATLYPQK